MSYKKIEDGEIYWFVFDNKVGRNNCPCYGKCLLEKCIACKVVGGIYVRNTIFIEKKPCPQEELKNTVKRYICTKFGTIIKEEPYVQSQRK